MTKTALIQELRDDQAKWQALLAEVGPARMEQSGVAGHWSVKDLVAHLTGWRRRTITRLQAVLKQEPDPPPYWPAHLTTDDAINAWFYETSRAHTLDEVLADADAVFEELLAAIAALPDEVVANPTQHITWWADEPFDTYAFMNHYYEHEPDIRRWLDQQAEA